MNFLAGPLGSMAAGAADTLTDNYWNNVLPNDEKAAANFKATVLKKKAARANAIATGNAINSRLASQAQALSAVEGFEEHSMADLIATIKMVEDAGLSKEGEAVAEILKNENLKYTIKPASAKSKETAPDVKEQTSMALGTTSGTSTTPEAESRSAFQIMMHGKGSRGIQDSVLKEMGMTRKDFEALSNPVVRKRLNIGESAIKLAVAKKISPGMQALVKQRQEHTLSLQGDLGPKTITDYISPVTKLPMTVSQLTYYIVSALDKDPNDPTANEYQGILDGMSLKKVGLEEVANNAQPTIESAVSFINDKKQNEEAKAEARALHKELNTLTSTLGRARNSEDMLNLQEKILQVQGELNLIIGRAADELNPEMPVILGEIDKMNVNPMQLVNGVPFSKAVTDLKIAYANLRADYPSLSTEEIQEEEQELIQRAMQLNSVMAIKMPKTIEGTHEVIIEAFKDNKLSGEIEVKSGEMMSVSEFVLKVYNNLYQSRLDGKVVDSKTLTNMQVQILSTRPLKDEEQERVDGLTRFDDVVKNSNAAGTASQVKSRFLDGKLSSTQAKLTQEIFKILTEKDNSIRLLHHEKKEDGTFKFTNAELDRMYTEHAAERATLINYLGKAATFENKNYTANLNVMKTEVENVRDVLKGNGDVFTFDEHKEILDLVSRFSSLSANPMAVGDDAAPKNEETLTQLGDITAKLILLGRKANLPEPTALDEKVEAMVEAEKQRRNDVNNPMTDIEVERAKVTARGMLVQGNVVVTKDGAFLQQPNFEKGSGIQLTQVPPLTAEGNLVAMSVKQLEKNDKFIKASLMGEATTGNILKTFMTHSNAFNVAGSAQLFGVNLSDLFNSMTGADIKPFLGGDKEKLADVQKARTDAFTLIQSARDQLFGGDSRLSDLDLKTLNSFLVVLESNGLSLVGTTRGQAALGIIQAAMTKDAMLREKDADFDNKLTIAESFERQTAADVANMSKEEKLFYKYEEKLGFKIGPDSGESLAKTAFYRVLRGYGIPNDRLASREEGKAMTEPERNLYKHKINFAIQQMEFVMSDFYVYVANGVEGKDKVVNQMLQNYKDKFK